jgi:hypothetical protein
MEGGKEQEENDEEAGEHVIQRDAAQRRPG